MRGKRPRSPTDELLRRHLRADSPRREAVICRGAIALLTMGLLSILVVPSDVPLDRSRMASVLGAALLYEVVILLYLRWGRYLDGIAWVNAFIECSAVMATLYVGVRRGELATLYASPAFIPLGGALVAGAVRLQPALSIATGLRSTARRPRAGPDGQVHAPRTAGRGRSGRSLPRDLHPEGGFEKVVAIKRVLPAMSRNPTFTRLFLEEARLCATLSHPNVVQVTDCGRFHYAFILAMEYVDGASLALVHRDVNPANVLVSRFGEVKLADFGVTHAARSEERPDAFYGKVQYAAPEQLRGGAIDGRVDLFALGITLWELLTSRRAFEGSETDIIRAVLELPPTSDLHKRGVA